MTPEEIALQRIEEAARTGAPALDLRDLELETLPDTIGNLIALRTLYLSRNQLSALPDAIGNLTALQELYLHTNWLCALPDAIGNLKTLQTLDLGANQLSALPETIGRLRALQILSLSENQLCALPEAIGRLNKLQILRIRRNQLSALPEAIGHLSALQSLRLRGNKLRLLPETIGDLAELWALHLSNNELRELPSSIGHLSALKSLRLSGNELRALPDEIRKLSALEALDVTNNQLRTLPYSLRELPKLQQLYLHGNEALSIPPEVLGPGRNQVARKKRKPGAATDILAFYFRGQSEASRPLHEAKILIVGQAAVGKSSLVDRLVRDEYDPDKPMTEGIAIDAWSVTLPSDEAIKVNLWDFGGQEIMHATHQFFLTTRSLYLVVLDARKGEDESRLHAWLKIVESFGADSPVIVVINKCDSGHRLELNERGLKRDYPSIRAIIGVSCETRQGIDGLSALIQDQIRALPHVADRMPVSFFNLKRDLEARTEDYLTFEQYRAACCEHGIETERDQASFLRILHVLGSMLNYDDPDSPYALRDTSVLKPEWVTDGVYRILNNNALMQAGGIVDMRALPGILTDHARFPPDRHHFIVEMMRKFELCFDFPDQPGRLLIPELLSPNEPDVNWSDDGLRFEYHYDVLPHGLISRFIVRMHQCIARRTCWKTGVVLEIEGNKALVRADLQANRMFISVIAVIGSEHTRRSALTSIRTTFRAIHGSISALDVAEKVPLPEDPSVLLDYQDLIAFERAGETDYPVRLSDGRVAKVDIRRLLDGVVPPKEREDEMTKHGRRGTGDEAPGASTTFNVYGPVAGNVGPVSGNARVRGKIEADQIFTDMRTAIRQQLADDPQKDALLAKVAELEQARGTPTFKQRYQEFMALAANHMSVVAPFLPALTQLL